MKDGSPWNSKVTAYLVPASVTTDVTIGDCVTKAGTANSAEVQGYKIGTLPTVAKSAATGAITGVVTSVKPVTDESKIYSDGSADRIVYVADDPRVVFRAQCDGTLAIANIGLNADRTVLAGSTVTGNSQDEIDLSSVNTTATLQLKILKVSNIEGNEIGAAAQADVLINAHTEANNTAGA
jgi:uncharacterized protein (UPF0264 family)